MPPRTNSFGQPIGSPVCGWTPRPRPPRTPMQGRLCRLDPLRAELHARALHAAYARDAEGRNWTYLPYGPFESSERYAAWVASVESGEDPQFWAIVDAATSQPVGVASYLRIEPAVGVIEVGHLSYSPLLQGTTAATEAMFLMLRRAFDELGYRRYEWKCDALNAPSRAAAERLGFQCEGIFRQALVTKGRNRDTAWFSILDCEWPAVKAAHEEWLAPANFDPAGRQRKRLADLLRTAFDAAGLRRAAAHRAVNVDTFARDEDETSVIPDDWTLRANTLRLIAWTTESKSWRLRRASPSIRSASIRASDCCRRRSAAGASPGTTTSTSRASAASAT